METQYFDKSVQITLIYKILLSAKNREAGKLNCGTQGFRILQI